MLCRTVSPDCVAGPCLSTSAQRPSELPPPSPAQSVTDSPGCLPPAPDVFAPQTRAGGGGLASNASSGHVADRRQSSSELQPCRPSVSSATIIAIAWCGATRATPRASFFNATTNVGLSPGLWGLAQPPRHAERWREARGRPPGGVARRLRLGPAAPGSSPSLVVSCINRIDTTRHHTPSSCVLMLAGCVLVPPKVNGSSGNTFALKSSASPSAGRSSSADSSSTFIARQRSWS